MSSNINTASIDANFPVAGTNNSSQGFRDNFSSIKTNLNYAKTEISDLQSKAILKSALSGQTLNNDMSETILSNVTLQSASIAVEDLGEVAGEVELNFATSTHYVMTTTDNISIAFTDWPSSGVCGSIRLVVTIGNAGHQITLPKEVTLGLEHIASVVSTLDNTGVISYSVVSFVSPGVYVYDFETIDHGTTVLVLDQSRGTGSGSTGTATVQTATTGRLGVVRIGSGLAITAQGILSTNLSGANLPVATSSSVGGVKQGSGLAIAGDGTISVSHVLGVGQTWQDVTSSRAVEITYTNSTAFPICISISAYTYNDVMTLYVGSVVVGKTGGIDGGDGQLSAIVPAGITYKLSGAATKTGGPSITAWAELR